LIAGATAAAVVAYPAAATVDAHQVAAAKKVVKIKTAQKSPYGKILTTASGRTLYLYAKDTKRHSHCNGGCAYEWPPLTVRKGHRLRGVDGLTIVIRKNGKRQAALHGKPLYRYGGDTKAGQVHGQGVDGVWFVATPHGASHATAEPSPSQSPPPSGGYGY
jgi:predicted lipoprotein with Yx(FWY)xxD motif